MKNLKENERIRGRIEISFVSFYSNYNDEKNS